MNRDMKKVIVILTSAVMAANEISQFLKRQKAQQEAIEALERTKARLEQFQYDIEFASMIQNEF